MDWFRVFSLVIGSICMLISLWAAINEEWARASWYAIVGFANLRG